jgi:hypothetical protein
MDEFKLSPKQSTWIKFSEIALSHVKNYSEPQYGPDIKLNSDVENTKDCRKYIFKYLARAGSERRGRIEELRDLIKIAHFAQIGFDMMEPTQEEIEAIREGRR